MTSGPNSLDHLIHRIYELADTPQGWLAFLNEAARHFGAERAHLFLVAPRGVLEECEFLNIEANQIRAFHENFQQDDPRIQLSLANPGRVLCDDHLGSDFDRSLVFNDYLKPQDIHHNLFVQAQLEPELILAQAIFRSRREGAFHAGDVERFQRLLPHVARAVRLRRTLLALNAELRDLRLALNLLPIPVAVLDRTGRLICASSRAEELLSGTLGLRLDNQRLTAAAPRNADAIAKALQQTAALSEGSGAPFVRGVTPVVEIAQLDGRKLSLTFFPLRSTHQVRERADASARVMVVLHDPSAVVRVDPSLVAQLHGLTATEAELATALASGRSLAEFAVSRGCSEQTARTHLKRILEKTGTHRQAELVRLVISTPAAAILS